MSEQQRHRNPMGLNELRELLDKTTHAMEQLQATIDTARSEIEQGLMTTLYTKLLLVKIQITCDMERFK